MSVSELDGILLRDGTGLYNPILDYLSKTGLIKKVIFNPGKRARRVFLDDEVDCLFPSSSRLLKETSLLRNAIIISEPVAVARGLVIFHDMKKPALLNKSLQMGVVGIVDLYGYKNVSTIDVKSYLELVSLVEMGRLEAGYFMYPDVFGIKGLAERLKSRLPLAVKIWEEPDSFLCRKKHAGTINKISGKIKSLKQNGQLLEGALDNTP